jgi:hypothetical protein
MLVQRRTLLLLIVLAVLGIPAAALRAACVGRSCPAPEQAPRNVPFCSLPADLRSRIAAGFHEERSPDVLAVTGPSRVRGGSGFGAETAPPWPSVEGLDRGEVPIVFWGTGIDPSADVPAGTGLRDVAPTLASALGFRIPHPEVRSGRTVPGLATGEPPRLVVMVVWKGVGSSDLQAAPGRWPHLARLLEEGTGTLSGQVGSLPLDPAAALATVGTGGLPAEHGIPGSVLRVGDGVVGAWSRGAPVSVIATLADDLDHRLRQRPLIGLVGTTSADLGAIGGNWYLGGDRDDLALVIGGPGGSASAVAKVLRSGYGADRVPDLLAVAMEGSIQQLDAALIHVLRVARRAAGGSLAMVVAATGSTSGSEKRDLAAGRLRKELERALPAPAPVVQDVAVGGLFLDQRALADTGITAEVVLRQLRGLTGPDGRSLFVDAFPGIAVTLSRYC